MDRAEDSGLCHASDEPDVECMIDMMAEAKRSNPRGAQRERRNANSVGCVLGPWRYCSTRRRRSVTTGKL